MFTLIAWQESLASGGFVYQNLAACVDPHIHYQGDYNFVPALWPKVIFGAGRGKDMLSFKINSPSLRGRYAAGMGPVDNLSSLQYYQKPNCNDLTKSPLPLVPTEGVEALVQRATGSASYLSAILALSDGPVTPVTGEIYSIDFSATITTVLSTWVNGAITLEETLPAGRYQLVGAVLWGLEAIAFRFVIPGANHRPGGIACHDIQTTVPDFQRNGGLGVWGEFDHDTLPSMDLIAETAASQGVGGCLDLIKIA
jgi:hypothetical protein